MRLLPSNGRIVEGSIQLDGHRPRPTKSENALRRYRWREISIVFQGAMNALNPVRRVRDQIAEPIEHRLSMSPKAARRRAGELLELVGIPKARGRAYPHELSGGMRQRAMIAMALACDPAIVIGDEPTTALDVMVQAQILQLLEDLRHKLGLAPHPHHPRPVGHRRDLRSGPDHVRRTGGRGGSRGCRLSAAAPPVHPEAVGRVPEHRDDRRSLEVIPGSPPDLREPPPGCRFAPRCYAAMAVCSEVVPPEIIFDGIRVACHLYHEGGDGTPVTTAPADAIGPTVVGVG